MTANYHVEIEQIESALGDRIYVRTRTFPDGVVVTDTLLTTGPEEPLSVAPDWVQERGKAWPMNSGQCVWGHERGGRA